MKKNIIMIIITLVCSVSLLLVLYFFNTKDIYYVGDKIIDNNEITMQIKSGSTYTEITKLSDLDNAKYYRISSETNCSPGSANFYYSNSTNKLKVKVNTSPLKCKIVFEEIREDINIVAIYINDVEQAATFAFDASKFYYLDSSSFCSNTGILSWDTTTVKMTINQFSGREYCTAKFLVKNDGETDVHFIERMMRSKYPTITENTYTSLNALMDSAPLTKIASDRQIMMYIASNPSLLQEIKTTTNYYNFGSIFADVGVLSQQELYTYGFPFYAFSADKDMNVIDGLFMRTDSFASNYFDNIKYTCVITVANASNFSVVFGRNSIDVTKYSKVLTYGALHSSSTPVGSNLTNTSTIGMVQNYSLKYPPQDFDESVTYSNTTVAKDAVWTWYVVDISQITGNYYYKVSVYHGNEYAYGLTSFYINHILFM